MSQTQYPGSPSPPSRLPQRQGAPQRGHPAGRGRGPGDGDLGHLGHRPRAGRRQARSLLRPGLRHRPGVPLAPRLHPAPGPGEPGRRPGAGRPGLGRPDAPPGPRPARGRAGGSARPGGRRRLWRGSPPGSTAGSRAPWPQGACRWSSTGWATPRRRGRWRTASPSGSSAGGPSPGAWRTWPWARRRAGTCPQTSCRLYMSTELGEETIVPGGAGAAGGPSPAARTPARAATTGPSPAPAPAPATPSCAATPTTRSGSRGSGSRPS